MGAMPNMGGYLQMLKSALASMAQQGQPAPGQPGSAVTPQMAQIVKQNPSLAGQNFQGATVAGVQPGAPPMPPQGGPSALNGIAGAAPGLARMLNQGDPRDPRMRRLPPHQGQGTQPRPLAPNPTPQPPPASAAGSPQAAGGGVPSVGSFLASPAGQQLMQQMQKALGIGAR